VTNLKQRIEDIELKAAESDLLSTLSTDDEVRIYNRRLTVELRQYAQKLRQQLAETA
jgi:hypothetical protein